MAMDIPTLRERYIGSCRRHGVLPNSSILSSFLKAEIKKSCRERCCLEIFLDDIKDIDFPSLLDICMDLDNSEIEAVNLRNESTSEFNGEYALSLVRAINQKLRIVDLQDLSSEKDFLWDISQRGLACQVLILRSSHLWKLNMVGEFMNMHTLNLDFCSSLTSFQGDCFNCMPNLMRLSMCETRVSNLWTTVAALSKLPSLVELRFQYILHCNDDMTSYTSSSEMSDDTADFFLSKRIPCIGESCIGTSELTEHNFSADNPLSSFYSFDDIMNHDAPSIIDYSSDACEIDISHHHQRYWWPAVFTRWYEQAPLQNEVVNLAPPEF